MIVGAHDSMMLHIQLTDVLRVKVWPQQLVQSFPVCYDGSFFFSDLRKVNLKVVSWRSTLCLYHKRLKYSDMAQTHMNELFHWTLPQAGTRWCQNQPQETISV